MKGPKKSRLLSRHSSCSRADKIFVFNKVFVIYFLKRFSPPPVDTHTQHIVASMHRGQVRCLALLPDIVSSLPPASPLFVNCQSWGKRVAHFQPLNSERSCFVNLSALSPGRCGQPIGNMWNYMITCEVWLSLAKSYGERLHKKLVPNLGNVLPTSATMSEGWE